jgi:hypothetical protein
MIEFIHVSEKQAKSLKSFLNSHDLMELGPNNYLIRVAPATQVENLQAYIRQHLEKRIEELEIARSVSDDALAEGAVCLLER